MEVLTERDTNLLFDLYKYRTLSIEQISNVHFNGKVGYTYRRLYLLKKEGFVHSYPLVRLKNDRRAGCYYITEKGIDILEELEMIDQARRARDNKVSGPALPHIIEINELFAQLSPSGWEFRPSREVKAAYGMNRSSLVNGSLVDKSNKEYMVYLLQESSREDTIEQITREIQTHDFEHVLILCKGKESYFDMKQALQRVLIAGTVNILLFPFALKVLKALNGEKAYQQLFMKYGPIYPVHTKHDFTRSIIHHQGEDKYLVNYLLGDQVSMYFLKKYTYDRYQMDRRRVMLFAWKGQMLELQEEFNAYPHIELVMVQLQNIQTEEESN